MGTTCNRCRTTIAFTQEQEKFLRESSTTFYCLWGHGNWYPPKAEADRYEKVCRERDIAKQQIARAEQEKAQEREARLRAEASLANAQAAARRSNARLKAGVCPCCNRTFKQLAAHMKNKHADFMPEVFQ